MVTSGTSKRIPREHLERFREEAKSHGSIEEMLEAYEKEKEQESAKVAPPAASSGEVPSLPLPENDVALTIASGARACNCCVSHLAASGALSEGTKSP